MGPPRKRPDIVSLEVCGSIAEALRLEETVPELALVNTNLHVGDDGLLHSSACCATAPSKPTAEPGHQGPTTFPSVASRCCSLVGLPTFGAPVSAAAEAARTMPVRNRLGALEPVPFGNARRLIILPERRSPAPEAPGFP